MITKEQLKERRKFLGSTDIAALFTDDNGKSLDPFKTAVDVWALKTFEQEENKNRETKSIKTGIRWEPYIVDWVGNEIGCKIETNPKKLRFINKGIIDKNGNPIFACNLDGYTEPKPHKIIEAKKTRLWAEWGEENTDDAPYRVLLQVHQQMLCTGWNFAYVGAMIQGEEKLFPVERNEDIIKAIIERGLQFWNDHVLTKIPPPESEVGNLQIFKRIIRLPDTFANVDNYIIDLWERRRLVRIECEKSEDNALAELLAKLGDAEGVRLDDGRTFTFLKQKGKDIIDLKKLKLEFPETYAYVSMPNEHRVARIKKGK